MANEKETCPGCGVTLPFQGDAPHPYLGSSGSCWTLYGQVLAREYQEPVLMTVHRLTVDAYAAQHPGKPDRRSTQSVWVHLTGLYLVVERKLSADFARRVLAVVASESDRLTWLTPPTVLGSITIADVAAVKQQGDHLAIVPEWACSVWTAWKMHHTAIAYAADRAIRRL